MPRNYLISDLSNITETIATFIAVITAGYQSIIAAIEKPIKSLPY